MRKEYRRNRVRQKRHQNGNRHTHDHRREKEMTHRFLRVALGISMRARNAGIEGSRKPIRHDQKALRDDRACREVPERTYADELWNEELLSFAARRGSHLMP